MYHIVFADHQQNSLKYHKICQSNTIINNTYSLSRIVDRMTIGPCKRPLDPFCKNILISKRNEKVPERRKSFALIDPSTNHSFFYGTFYHKSKYSLVMPSCHNKHYNQFL